MAVGPDVALMIDAYHDEAHVPKLAAARGWKRDAERALEAGEMVVGTSGQTVRQAGDALIEAMRSGIVRTRSGRTYKPSAIRTFQSNLELHI